MPAFLKSDQVVQDLLATLEGTTTTSQQLKEALLRESNCDYSNQIISSLNSGTGEFPDKVRSLKQDSFNSTLRSARRYFFNDKSAEANTAKHKFVFDYQSTESQVFDLPIHGAEYLDLLPVYKTQNPEYQVTPQNTIIVSNSHTYIVNVKLSMIIYDGLNAPGPSHYAPTFLELPTSTVVDITVPETVGSFFSLDLGYLPHNQNAVTSLIKHGGGTVYVFGNRIVQFRRIELNSTYVFKTDTPAGTGLFNTAVLNLSISAPCCRFSSRDQHVGLFKILQANNAAIDSSNYVDIICVGNTGV